MRASLASLVPPILVVAMACGGGGETGGPAPTGPAQPATVAIQAGDGQMADAGAAVPITPAVVVKDASGRGVAGVAVTFAIDSGGGHVASSTASTDGQGVASSGGWTLGPNEGPNVLVATVSGVGSTKFRATALPADIALADQTISLSGGTITVAKAGDPLDGLSVRLATHAYPGDTHWRITSKPKIKVNLPEGARQLGVAFEIGNDAEYADSAFFIHIPVHVGADTALAAFYYDTTSKTLELIPTAAINDGSITVATQHVRSTFLWTPRHPSSSRASGARAGAPVTFGSVVIVVAGVPSKLLSAAISTGFAPGVDGWEFTNYGSEIEPLGICLGMSVSAMYYYARIKPTAGKGLFHQYDRVASYDWDNPQGIRFASMIQYHYSSNTAGERAAEAQLAAAAASSKVPLDVVTYQTLLVAMFSTKQPQLFTMDNGTGGHAVVAYRAANGVISLADPNQPGKNGVTATFSGSAWQPVTLQPIASAPPSIYPNVWILGTSAFLPTTTIDAEWQKFQGGVAGNGTFTSHYFSWADSDPGNPTQTYTPIVDSVTTWASQIIFAVDCAACKPNRFRARQLVDRTGHLLNNPLPTDTDYVDSVGLWSQINGSFSDFRWTKVHVRGLGLTAPANANAFSAVTLTAQPHGHAPPGAQYVWDFGDSTTATFVDDSTATHSYQAQNVGAGSTQCALGLSRLVTVELRDAKGNRLASASRCIFQRLAVRLAPASGLAGFSQTLAVNGGGNQAASGFQWTFGDGTPPVVVQGDTLVTHTFARPGNYKVRVTGWDINNVPDTTAFTPVQTFDRILPGEWRITSFTLVSSSPTVPTYFPTWNHAFDDSLTFYLQRVEHTPTDGMIFFPDDSLWRERAVYFQVAPPGAGASATYWVPRSQVWLVARDASVQFSHFTDTGTLTNGTVDGLGYTTNYGASFLHSITVTKSGQTMTGTLRFALYGTTAQRTYQFTAQLVP